MLTAPKLFAIYAHRSHDRDQAMGQKHGDLIQVSTDSP